MNFLRVKKVIDISLHMSENTDEAQAMKNIQEVLSDQQGEIEIPTFWQMVLKPKSNGENTAPVHFPDNTYLSLTNICLPEITDSENKSVDEPVRVFAKVKQCIELKDSTTLISTLIPGRLEHQNINILFSPIDEVTLELKGNLPVHIIGVIHPFEDTTDYDYEEEEEEVKEEENEEEKDAKEK